MLTCQYNLFCSFFLHLEMCSFVLWMSQVYGRPSQAAGRQYLPAIKIIVVDMTGLAFSTT
ncbi:uncharacterized protein PHALS_15482 [Plasmopara halstedii]|uniref:RxLR-like protein n=1 Tax=Plasmopara halstedii TaxID=4781 RepID=A0A0P1AI68_PLAHL|nr:uncharacterized protein PHALS_15482 [Plasmopara halstedii]CEG40998.1 hypothetical protein PHALS_15482 [Plasmopara halstedii]|eukprot:XP_024577367.1 hypothetical protein PHALS_15482 [Plasmopara halstedii]